jgi:hypothetical protein
MVTARPWLLATLAAAALVAVAAADASQGGQRAVLGGRALHQGSRVGAANRCLQLSHGEGVLAMAAEGAAVRDGLCKLSGAHGVGAAYACLTHAALWQPKDKARCAAHCRQESAWRMAKFGARGLADSPRCAAEAQLTCFFAPAVHGPLSRTCAPDAVPLLPRCPWAVRRV